MLLNSFKTTRLSNVISESFIASHMVSSSLSSILTLYTIKWVGSRGNVIIFVLKLKRLIEISNINDQAKIIHLLKVKLCCAPSIKFYLWNLNFVALVTKLTFLLYRYKTNESLAKMAIWQIIHRREWIAREWQHRFFTVIWRHS